MLSEVIVPYYAVLSVLVFLNSLTDSLKSVVGNTGNKSFHHVRPAHVTGLAKKSLRMLNCRLQKNILVKLSAYNNFLDEL